ncbi:MAG: hypothetical protein QF511_13505 [Rhodospirillales bacterium]|nr:hypothetical protein [Rhodospirillales bacterium]MDP7099493.1 hypothetical protein [Rhodospirillales bacterium]MDP7216256.1 hypothetical protein [Rhodospirillales bacterium]HIJ92137.1 hypothetical protein [Rhodospirillaceae bacterium]
MKRTFGYVLIIGLIATGVGGCMVDRIGTLIPDSTLNIARNGIVDARVALLLTPDVKSYVWQGRATGSIFAVAQKKAIPLGQGIQLGFSNGCTQVFAKCRVVETMPPAADYDVLIIPRVLNYSIMRDDTGLLGGHGEKFGVKRTLSMEVKTKVGGGAFKTRVYEKSLSGERVRWLRHDSPTFVRADRSAAEKVLAAVIQDVFRDLLATPAVSALPLRPRPPALPTQK